MEMTNKETVVEFFMKGHEGFDEERLMEIVNDEYMDNGPCQARTNRECVEILRAMHQSFTDIKVDVEDLIEEDGKVCIRSLFTVSHTGEYGGIPATGRRISFDAVEIFRVENGRIVESWGYWPDSEIKAKLS